jgi:hypothetical protein
MALSTSYLVTTKNFDALINALLSAKAPEKFNRAFLTSLDFTSSNDTLYIRLFKDLGLIDSSNVPTERYYRFLDQSESKRVFAECIDEAYSDLFAINKRAYDMSEGEIKNKLKTLTQGSKEDNVLGLMAKTFKAICEYADWSIKTPTLTSNISISEIKPKDSTKDEPTANLKKVLNPSLHYNIEIHLPETRDSAVYDAIFRSLKEHLFS